MNKILMLIYLLAFSLTENAQTITDIDGNTYNLITIGNQVWLKENLKTTRYNDGTLIPIITDSIQWINMKTSGYCWYNNDSLNFKTTYGALYNFYTITDNLCPSGWRVPSDDDFSKLFNNLISENQAGCKLKEAGITHWKSPNLGADNSSGFTALPGGARIGGAFNYIGDKGNFWSSTEMGSDDGKARSISYQFCNVPFSGISKTTGYSIRCMRDNLLSINSGKADYDLNFYTNQNLLHIDYYSSDNCYFEIYDSKGINIKGKQKFTSDIDISSLSIGFYVIKIIDSQIIKTFKFIKK